MMLKEAGSYIAVSLRGSVLTVLCVAYIYIERGTDPVIGASLVMNRYFAMRTEVETADWHRQNADNHMQLVW